MTAALDRALAERRIPFEEGRHELLPRKDGMLTIWEHPNPDETYIIGADAAEGIRGGDYSVGCVLRLSDCAQVAEFRGHLQVDDFGKVLAQLGWYYRNAVLVIETYPSAHGMAAWKAARTFGYKRLWYRKVTDVRTKKITDKPGWSMDAMSHPQLMDRVRRALIDGYVIRSPTLIGELLAMRMEQKREEREAGKLHWRVVSRDHDDCHDAYGIALCIRDQVYFQARDAEEAPRAPRSLQEVAEANADRREGKKSRFTIQGPQGPAGSF